MTQPQFSIPPMFRAFYCLLANTLLGLSAAIIYIVWLMVFDGNPPITFYNDPGTTDQAVYSAGDTVKVHREVCQYNQIDGTLHMFLVGRKHIYPLPDVNRPYREGCVSVEFPALVIAPTVEADFYYIDARIDFVVNRLATRTVKWRSTLFEVQ